MRTAQQRRLCTLFAALSVAACGPSAGGGGDSGQSGTESETSSTSESASASGASNASTTATGTTAGVDTTAGPVTTDESTSTDTATSTTGVAVCPPPERVSADFSVIPDQDISADCTVQSTGRVMGGTAIELGCDAETITLTVTASPTPAIPWVFIGDPVHLEYITEPIFWTNRWFALHSAGEGGWLLAGGASTSSFDPPKTTAEMFFTGTGTEPVLSVVEGQCEPIDSDCSAQERVAVELTLLDDLSIQAFDQGSALIDVLSHGYRLVVPSAVHNLKPHDCDDLPIAWYQFITVFFPSD